jgi:hypothetical protein
LVLGAHGDRASPDPIDERPMSAHDSQQPTRTPADAPPGSPPDDESVGVTGTQMVASVLASVSAAVVASVSGVAGTIVGAAVVSVVATVGSAAYGLGIHRTRARLQQVQAIRLTRPPASRPASGDDDTTPVDAPTQRPAPPSGTTPVDVPTQHPAPPSGTTADSTAGTWRASLARRRWSLAAGAAIVFVVSLAVVTLVEVVGDRPLSGESSGSGRTSVGSLFAGGDGDGAPDAPATTEPATDPSSTAPSPSGSSGQSTTTREPDAGSTTTTTEPPAKTTTTAPAPTTAPTPTTTAPPAAPAGPAG